MPTRPLPHDVWSEIGVWADRHTLKSLRLVNRDMHHAVDIAFRHRFFAYRKHLLTDYSLDVLESIVATTRLCRSINTLCLVSNGWSGSDADSVRPHAFARITGIFNAFASANLSPRLELVNRVDDSPPWFDEYVNSRCRWEDVQYCPFGERENQRNFHRRRGTTECNIPQAFLWSVSSSRFEVSQLRLTVKSGGTAAGILQSTRFTALLGSSTITSLDLGAPLKDACNLDNFTKAMQLNDTLETLILRMRRGHHVLGRLVDAFSEKRLKSVAIFGEEHHEHTIASEDDIKRFFMPHRDTIRHLELYACKLDSGGWVSTFENLANYFTLSSCVLSSLADRVGEMQSRDSHHFPDWHRSYYFPHLGKVDLRQFFHDVEKCRDWSGYYGWLAHEHVHTDWVTNTATLKVIDAHSPSDAVIVESMDSQRKKKQIAREEHSDGYASAGQL